MRDVSSWPVVATETSGEDEKLWLGEPDTATSSSPTLRWLFKPITQHDGWEQGEDWAELIAAEVASQLGIPHARIELAERDGRRGNISLDLRPPDWEMQPGVLVLAELDRSYQPGWDNVPGRPGHSLSRIQKALEAYGPPPGATLPPTFEAFDVFSGYLMLDALIANQDRHDENWAILRSQTGDDRSTLCGSYDHAGSFAYNRKDEWKRARLRQRDVEQWARKGAARRFEHIDGPPVSLVDLARQGLALVSAEVRDHWNGKLRRLDVTYLTDCLSRVPFLSDEAATFASEVLAINMRRLIDVC